MSNNAPAPLAAESAPPPPPAHMRRFLLVVVPLVAAAAGLLMWLHGGRIVETDNAYVKAEKFPVSPQIGGQVVQVLVAENQPVRAGEVLFRIDPAPLRVAVMRAEARLAQVRNDVAALKAAWQEKQAEIALARSRLDYAIKDQQRQSDLVARNFVSAARYDDARQAADLARQQMVALEQDLKRLAASLGGNVNTPVERQAEYLVAQADLEQARLNLQRVDVRAPQDGITSKPPKIGQYLQPGATAMALVGVSAPWIEANFTETDLTWVRPGESVSIRVDTYPDVRWQGVVESLSPATGSEFSLIPAQNATGNWVKIAQRVAVRIRLQPVAGQPVLRAGLSAQVQIDTGHKRRLAGLSL